MEMIFRKIIGKRKKAKKFDDNYREVLKRCGVDVDKDEDYEVWAQLSFAKTLIEMGELEIRYDDAPYAYTVTVRVKY